MSPPKLSRESALSQPETLAPVPFDFKDIVIRLESHPEALRIKKIIYSLTQKTWENDLEILNRTSFEELLQDVVTLYPNSDRLKYSVYELVASLNRTEVYIMAAKAIIEHLKNYYKSDQSIEIKQASDSDQDYSQTFSLLLDRVVSCLKNQKQRKRIKKIIFCVCKNRWENNIAAIRKYSTKTLILELYRTKPELTDLETSLAAIVNNLNKSEIYVPLNQIIINCISILYEYKKIKNEDKKDEQEDISIYVDENPSSDLDLARPVNNQLENKPIEPDKTIIQQGQENFDIAKQNLFQSKSKESPKSEEINFFDLRLNILQYTNPLRVKMLLFSILNHDKIEREIEEGLLKNFTLDALLRQIIEYDQNYDKLKQQMFKIVRSSPQPEENQQAAENLLKIIEPLLQP